MEAKSSKVYKLVLVRHGESKWNMENRFTGWTDVDLSDAGVAEALEAGTRLKDWKFDVVHTSVLKRAIKTWNNIAEVTEQHHVPVFKHWRLNERHYGALQGLNKSETAEKHGEEQVKIWRRAYDISPPPLEKEDERYPGHDSRYALLPSDVLPVTECLKDTVARVLPYWHDRIAADMLSGKRVIVVAHGNSIRAIVKHFDNLTEEQVINLNIPTALPLVYELDADLKPIKHYYLATDEELTHKLEAVANQGKVKK